MRLSHHFYETGLRVVRTLAPLLASGDSKWARGIRGRARDREAFERWAARERDPGRPLVWLHAPSVGEGLQARAVLDALRVEVPQLQAVYSYFSPSAEGLAAGMPVDAAAYLPWDLRSEAGRILDALAPRMIAFTKTEVWPGIAEAAKARGIAVVLVAATLPEDAGRLRAPARRFLAPTFGSLDRVLAISAEDGMRFRRLGVAPERISVTGDPAIDSAWRRARAADPSAPFLAPFHADPRPTLVAGSTWGPDEEVLVPGLSRVRDAVPELRLVIAPHEPDEGHLASLEAALARHGWRSARLGGVEADGRLGDEADAIVVDRVGVLAALYTVGSVAYVGGGFHRHGLHSVIEPAAAGLPVLFGPRFGNSRAAADLRALGGAESVPDVEALARVAESWLTDPSRREGAARVAAGYIEEHRGAAERTARALEPLFTASTERPGEAPHRAASTQQPEETDP